MSKKSVYQLSYEIEAEIKSMLDKVYWKSGENERLNKDLTRLLSMIESISNKIDMRNQSLREIGK